MMGMCVSETFYGILHFSLTKRIGGCFFYTVFNQKGIFFLMTEQTLYKHVELFFYLLEEGWVIKMQSILKQKEKKMETKNNM